MKKRLYGFLIISILIIAVLVICVAFKGLGPTDFGGAESSSSESDYSEATLLLENGEYDAAKAAFLALEGYSDSARMALYCDYLYAVSLMDSGDFSTALELFEGLGDFENSAELYERCREEIYASAKLSMINTEFEDAKESFLLLGDYRDSLRQIENCRERLEAEADFTEKELIIATNKFDEFENGTLYRGRWFYVFVPEEINADTSWLVYFPGGCGSGFNLSVPCIYLEHDLFTPNAIMIYLDDNGWSDMRSYSLRVASLMKQLALECDIWFHDVVTVGSSNGCYNALIAAPVMYDEEGITVDAVLAFDAGNEWEISIEEVYLTEAECDLTAEAGTTLYLFEQNSFSDYAMQVEPVAMMIEHGADVVVIECDNDGHNHIGPDAIRAGFYDWAMGQVEGLKPLGVTHKPYVIRMIKFYSDGSCESLDVPYLPSDT